MTTVDRPEATDTLGRYPWVATGVVLIGTFMVILDTTIVNVALPQIGLDLGEDSGIEWIVTGYLLAVGVSQPASGWMADRFGRKRTFIVSLGFFALGSALAALSPNLAVLVAFRVLQGLGGGAMMPVGLTMIYELFPPDRRGTAMGIWGIAAMAAPTIGPVLGGYIVTATDWRWLFFVNVPIGVVGVVVATRLLRDLGYRERRPLDWRGLVLVGGGLVLLLLAFSRAEALGWSSLPISGAIAGGAALLALCVRRSLRIPHPLVDLRMFAVPVFSVTIGIVWLLTAAQFARLVFVPLELQTLRGMSAFEVGILLTPGALGVAATMPIGGRLADRIGSRVPVSLGLVGVGVGTWLLGRMTPETSKTAIVVMLLIGGLGNGLAIMPNVVAAMNSLPARFLAQAAGVRSMNRQVAGALGTALLATLVASRIGAVSAQNAPVAAAQDAYNAVFLVTLPGLAVALVLAQFLPGRRRTQELQRERQQDHDEFVASAGDAP